jgi:hypothetical protein
MQPQDVILGPWDLVIEVRFMSCHASWIGPMVLTAFLVHGHLRHQHVNCLR